MSTKSKFRTSSSDSWRYTTMMIRGSTILLWLLAGVVVGTGIKACADSVAHAQVTRITGGAVNDTLDTIICPNGDLTLSLVDSFQDNLGTDPWSDMACLENEAVCFVIEDRTSVVTTGLFPLGSFVEFQFNVHRVNINHSRYDESVYATDSGIQSAGGDVCTTAGTDTICMTPSVIVESETDNLVFVADGQVADTPRRAGACNIPKDPLQFPSQCLNLGFGLTINDGKYAVNESTQKLFIVDAGLASPVAHRFSFTNTTLTDDSVSGSISGSGVFLAFRPRAIAIDEDGLIYVAGTDSIEDIGAINQDLSASVTAWTSSTGEITAMDFDDTNSALYVCGLTQVEKYSTTGTLQATSGAIGCLDVAVDELTGQVYVVTDAGNIVSLDPSDLTQDAILSLASGAGNNDIAGLEIDRFNRRAYAVNIDSGADIRTFYHVRTCAI